MKNFLTVFIILISFVKAQDLNVGFGAYFQTQPYKDTKAFILPTPVIFYDNGFVYARWTRFGVYFLGEKKENYAWGFSLTLEPRPNGYSPSDSKYLKGLSEKKSSYEGGLAFTFYKEGYYLEAMYLYDILKRYNSYITKTEMGFEKKFDKISFYPSVVLVYESKKFTSYYYGISSDEASKSIYDIYNPNGGIRIALQTYINYKINKKISLFCNFRADKISKEAKNSPIVDKNIVYSSLVSFLYKFDF